MLRHAKGERVLAGKLYIHKGDLYPGLTEDDLLFSQMLNPWFVASNKIFLYLYVFVQGPP